MASIFQIASNKLKSLADIWKSMEFADMRTGTKDPVAPEDRKDVPFAHRLYLLPKSPSIIVFTESNDRNL